MLEPRWNTARSAWTTKRSTDAANRSEESEPAGRRRKLPQMKAAVEAAKQKPDHRAINWEENGSGVENEQLSRQCRELDAAGETNPLETSKKPTGRRHETIACREKNPHFEVSAALLSQKTCCIGPAPSSNRLSR
ncbi:hypothetical protein Sfum_3963 [Syntrophobacter fumaroxidans MPOB]|uniref:Uncharacterized protein n=2 Tax=Syntrophobacter TaxID=29526 RepID=A0LQC8_SYNFM|nr:hypothetical protein Sfum_3963 [Syntrophobacter fumaroxidans MPOB]